MKFKDIQIPDLCVGCCSKTDLHLYHVNLSYHIWSNVETTSGIGWFLGLFRSFLGWYRLSEDFQICGSCQEIVTKKRKSVLLLIGFLFCVLVVSLIIIFNVPMVDKALIPFVLMGIPLIGIYILLSRLRNYASFIQLDLRSSEGVALIFSSAEYTHHFKMLNPQLQGFQGDISFLKRGLKRFSHF